jgi:hypothetical protein
MTYCSTTELIALTGTPLDVTTVLTPIIEAADKEINTYLVPYGLSGSSSVEAVNQASLKLAKAGLLDRGLHTGDYQAASGDFESKVDVIRAIEALRKAAFALLDQYIDAQRSLSASTRVFGRRVDGR